MNRREVIQQIIDTIGARDYLEIGVNAGRVFLRIKAARKVAVDPKFLISASRRFRWTMRNFGSKYHEVTSDAYFSGLKPETRFDVAFIDGLHTYPQALRDVENALAVLNDGGVIVMHDCNPTTPELALPAESLNHALSTNASGADPGWCGDVWKTIAHLRSQRSDLRVFVLDCDFGLGIVTRGQPESKLSVTPAELEKFAYTNLETDRQQLLNLKPESYFSTFLAGLKKTGRA